MNLSARPGVFIGTLCTLVGYSRQAFHQYHQIVEREVLSFDLIIQEVIRIRTRQKRIGTRKLLVIMSAFFIAHNFKIGRDTFFDLLSEEGLLIRLRRRRVPITTFSGHWLRKYPNLIIDVHLTSAAQLLVSDITYITLKSDRFAYLSLVTDAYSRMIVGFHLSENLNASGCVKALKMAILVLPPEYKLIHHSDRGSQYCSAEYVKLLTGHKIDISMTQNGDPRENAIAERVNGILKQELLEVTYDDFEKADEAIKMAVQIYNYERPHSSIEMLTPFEAHSKTGDLKRLWKSYRYKNKKNEEVK